MRGEEGRSQVSPKDAAVSNNLSESDFTAAETERGRSMGQHEGCACTGCMLFQQTLLFSHQEGLKEYIMYEYLYVSVDTWISSTSQTCTH